MTSGELKVKRQWLGGAISLSGAICICAGAIQAQEIVSEVPDIMVAAAIKLPKGPGPFHALDNCGASILDPETLAGRLVQLNDWAVLSDVQINDFSLVSFAGELIAGTSGSCEIRQGNIGIFEAETLIGILYTARKSDALIGRLTQLENGTVRVWSGGYLEYPVADILVGSMGLYVQAVSSEEAFCDGEVSVPNIFGTDITAAREKLQAAGWEPEAQARLEAGQQPALQDIGVVEAVDCSGTGFGFCAYEYRRQGASLDVTTTGELWEHSVPAVTNYAVRCEN